MGVSKSTLQGAHDGFYEALNLLLHGNDVPFRDVWSDTADVTFMGPMGGSITTGASAVLDNFHGVSQMGLGGRVTPEDVHIVELGDMGYSTCVERGVVHTIGGALVSVSHRATNIFRREGGAWRMVPHHTDLSSGLNVIP